MNTLSFPIVASIICHLLVLAPALHAQDGGQQKPNIVVILVDDLGYADLSFLPHAAPDVDTPNIDRIAEDGTYFSNAYSTSPICSPSRAGLISGMNQARWGNYWYGEGGLPDSVVTLPQRLRQAGYVTRKIGKTHLNGGPVEHPLDHGFDSFLGFIDHTWDYLRLSEQDVKEYGPQNARRAHIGPLTRNHEPVSYQDDFTTDIFSRDAAGFIKADRDRPFYLHLSYNAVHHPTYIGHPDYLEEFGIEQFPFWDPQKESYRSWHYKWGHLGKVDPDGRKRYLLQLAVLDDGIGQVLEALETGGQRDNTCIVFTSDNGGTINTFAKNDPLNGHKYMFGEGGIRIPMIISCPDKKTGQTISSLVSAMDIYPTVLELAGDEVPQNLDGKSLVPHLEGDASYTPHQELFWTNGRDSWVVRKGPWKLVHNIGWSHSSFVLRNGEALRAPDRYRYPGGIRLYNLEENIRENEDLSGRYPEKVRELTERYQEWRSGMSEPRRGNGTLKPGPNKGEQLPWDAPGPVYNAYSNSSDNNHYANLTVDGYAGTYWHSVTGMTAFPLPHHVVVNLKRSSAVKGIRYLPVQQSTRGRIEEYRISVSRDGQTWEDIQEGRWDDSAKLKTVRFSEPVQAKYLRLEARSAYESQNYAAIAEIGIIGE